MPPEDFLAHIAEDGRRHLLREYLAGAAERAAIMAAEFCSGEWGCLAGYLSKLSVDFLRKLYYSILKTRETKPRRSSEAS